MAQVRMGLNSGEVVVGKIGDDLRMDYTALGHTADLAARMEQIAEPGRIYLAEATAQICQGFFALRDLGRHEVRGLAQPVGVFELEGVGRMRTSLDVSRSCGFSGSRARSGSSRPRRRSNRV
jgi:class 3 adenylate cyclase